MSKKKNIRKRITKKQEQEVQKTAKFAILMFIAFCLLVGSLFWVFMNKLPDPVSSGGDLLDIVYVEDSQNQLIVNDLDSMRTICDCLNCYGCKTKVQIEAKEG